MQSAKLLTGFFLAICTLPLAAEVHRCSGDNGSVSFSDTPCGEETTTLKKYRPVESVDDVPGNSKRERLLRAFEEERRQAEEKAEKQAAEKAEREMKCRHARDRLRVVRQAGRIYNVDDDGNRVVQTDEARAETTRQAEDYVAYWCK